MPSSAELDIILQYGTDPEVWVYISWAILLLIFIFAVLYAHYLWREPVVRSVILDYSTKITPVVAGAVFMGIAAFLALDHINLPEHRSTMESFKGRATAVGFGMSGLTFLLVFRTSQSQSRWWEGRGHCGAILLNLKLVVICACAEKKPNHAKDVAILAKLLFHCIRVWLQEEPAQPLQAVLERISPNSSFEGFTQKTGINPARQRLWTDAKPAGRVMICWKWLRDSAVGSAVTSVHHAQQPIADLYAAIHGAGKVKMHGKEENMMHILEGPMFYTMLLYFVPVELAFQWHVGLSQMDLQLMQTRHVVRLDFVFILSIVTFFFTSLRLVANVSQDPFANVLGSLHLAPFQEGLSAELDMYVADAMAENNSSTIVSTDV